MRRLLKLTSLAFCLLVFQPGIGTAEDMRVTARQAAQQRDILLEKARHEQDLALREAEDSTRALAADKTTLLKTIQELTASNEALQRENQRLESDLNSLTTREKKLLDQLNTSDDMLRELSGVIRTSAKDVQTLLSQSQQSAFQSGRCAIVEAIIRQPLLPGMDDIREMVRLLFDEIRRCGEVRVEQGDIVDRTGRETRATILSAGNFTAAYQIPDEVGYLLYSDQSRRLFALSKLPSARIRKNLVHYMNGSTESMFLDISRGAALRQLTHQLSLMDQIWKGGPIIWPILAIGVIALFIIIERFCFLMRMDINADRVIKTVKAYVSEHQWQDCMKFCEKFRKKPVVKVLLAAVEYRHMPRSDLENVLQETILTEISRLERFLSTLGMLATISPLLGLLGTVTGMINTFHVITYYGTGNPKMMSGGISEALVTTMLGLAVAIPVMVCHTLLNRKVEYIIGQMEEKAVSLTNDLFTAQHEL